MPFAEYDTATLTARRDFLARNATGLGTLALSWLLQHDAARAAPAKPVLERINFDLLPKAPPQPPRAKAMISMFMQGGPSHVDLFDPKPELSKRHGQNYSGEIKFDDVAGASRQLFGSPWKFRRHGACGMELSELVSHLGSVADDICLIRSMRTAVNNHGQSIQALNTGRPVAGRPALGSWLTYALGSESQDLPAYVVLTDPTSLPVIGVDNWKNGYLPSLYQGTVVRSREPRILNLDPPPQWQGRGQEQFLAYMSRLNQEHLAQHPGETDLAARISSYELAARMQVAAKAALDIKNESEATQRLYGLDRPETREYGTRCLIARRLVERGVRFVQIYTGNQNWDHHGGIVNSLPKMCKIIDQPSAALVTDLKQRGLLDSTVVHWGGEMGRLPVIENLKNIGRDHNTYGFTHWVAGGGFKGGYVHGATDEFGHHAVEDVVMHHDYHATLLHLFGFDYERLVFAKPGGQASLVDGQASRVVKELLA